MSGSLTNEREFLFWDPIHYCSWTPKPTISFLLLRCPASQTSPCRTPYLVKHIQEDLQLAHWFPSLPPHWGLGCSWLGLEGSPQTCSAKPLNTVLGRVCIPLPLMPPLRTRRNLSLLPLLTRRGGPGWVEDLSSCLP